MGQKDRYSSTKTGHLSNMQFNELADHVRHAHGSETAKNYGHNIYPELAAM